MICTLRSMAFALLAIVLLPLSFAHGSLFVSIDSKTIATGSSGYVDVTIRSDSADALAQFGFEFRISTLTPTQLDFVSPQSDAQLTDGAYMFAGDSLAADAGISVGSVTTVVVPNDTYLGGDATLSGLEVPVPALPALLVRLELTTLTSLAPTIGDQFLVELVRGPNTFFQDSEFSDLPFSSTSGTVTIGAIPEPSSLALQAGALLLLMAIASRAQSGRPPRLRVP
jgi:hypothetical protein